MKKVLVPAFMYTFSSHVGSVVLADRPILIKEHIVKMMIFIYYKLNIHFLCISNDKLNLKCLVDDS